MLKQKYLGVIGKMDVDWTSATVKLVEFFFSTIHINLVRKSKLTRPQGIHEHGK